MDRISSCATRSSSETRISLSVPSRVANLSAMENRKTQRGGNAVSFLLGGGKTVTFIDLKENYNAPSLPLKITICFTLRLTNRKEPVPAPPSLFYLGSMSCGDRR